jgi:hypothetical protein
MLAGTQTEADNPSALDPVAEEPAGNTAPPPSEAQAPHQTEPSPPSLEVRVRRLEDIIATLQLAPSHRTDHIAEQGEPPASDGIVAAPRPSSTSIKEPEPLPPRPPLPTRGEPWLVFEIVAELRAMLRMYFDPRYRMSWYSRLMIPTLIVVIVLTRMFIANVWVIGWLLDIILFPILLYVLIKVLIREATRYRSTSPDLPPSMRI